MKDKLRSRLCTEKSENCPRLEGQDLSLNDLAIVDTYSEKCHRASAFESSVGDLCLFCEIGRVLDRRDHSLDGEERGQVGRIRGDDDQREEPPDSADDSRAGCLIMTIDISLT